MGNLLSFEGRVRRRDWWLYNIVVGLLSVLITQVIAPMALGDQGRVQVDPSNPFAPVYPLPLLGIMLLMSAILLWPSYAMATKRAHDRGKSAKLTIILMVISMICSLLGPLGSAMNLGLGGLALMALPVSMIIGIYLLVTLGFLDGTPGPNEYGPSPKGLGGTAETFS